jgi:hypothetical protein
MVNKIKKSKSNKFYGYSQKLINVIDNIIFRQNENIACFRYEEIDLQNIHCNLFSRDLKDCNAILEKINKKAVILKAIEDIHQNDQIICFFDEKEEKIN